MSRWLPIGWFKCWVIEDEDDWLFALVLVLFVLAVLLAAKMFLILNLVKWLGMKIVYSNVFLAWQK